MSYSALMAHLDLGVPNDGVLHVATALAERFEARVVGIAACEPMQIGYGDSYISGEVIDLDRQERLTEMNEAEQSFRTMLGERGTGLEWRSEMSFASPAEFIAREARSADLVITAPERSDLRFDASRRVGVGELIVTLGRPILIVPPRLASFALDCAIVAWKDTREARRASLDALPLLKKFKRVIVVEIAASEDLDDARKRLDDAVNWLTLHGVAAAAEPVFGTGDDVAQLGALVRERGADLLVGGAYGHARFREWVFGGMTRQLFLRGDLTCFVSH